MTDQSTTAPDKASVRRIAASSFFGTTVEYYDFLLYTSAAALAFPHVFFGELSPGVGAVLSFVTLLAGYLARPLGGIIFGHFGDRLGRKKMLLITLLIMGIASTLIGALPSFAQIGVWAPIVLTVLRVCQGIAVGGDWGGSASISVESSEQRRRGFFASFVNMGAPAGALVGTLVLTPFSALTDTSFYAWGWRVPFLGSAVLMAIGLWIRWRMIESPVFARVEASDKLARQRVPLFEALRHQWVLIVLIGFGMAGSFAIQGVLASYGLNLAVATGHHPRSAALSAFALGSALQIVGVCFFGWLSDRVGRRVLITCGAVVGMLVSIPALAMIASHSPALLRVGMLLGMVLVVSLMYGPSAAFIAERFRPEYRYSGSSLAYQIASTLGGGVAPLIATSLALAGGYIAVGIFLTITFVLGAVLMIAIGRQRESVADLALTPRDGAQPFGAASGS